MRIASLPVISALLLGGWIATQQASAHCDGMDGPVVKAAREALDGGDVGLVLVWVQQADEAAVKQAFTQTQAVRKLNAQARDLADLYFFETVVRVHRAGEGEPYTGLKPAGRDVGPAIASADKAIESGSADAVVKLISEGASRNIRERFQQVQARKGYSRGDIGAGREYVKAYVEFLHYVEGLHAAVQRGSDQHSQGAGGPGEHPEH